MNNAAPEFEFSCLCMTYEMLHILRRIYNFAVTIEPTAQLNFQNQPLKLHEKWKTWDWYSIMNEFIGKIDLFDAIMYFSQLVSVINVCFSVRIQEKENKNCSCILHIWIKKIHAK